MVEPLNKKRSLGQVFTPRWMVEKILDEIGFTVSNASIIESRVLEPSVGEGVFLQEVVRRVIQASRTSGINDKVTAEQLAVNIVGIDIDDSTISTCIKNLNEVFSQEEFVEKVEWSIFALDALDYTPEESFDYVVGNPPYISVHNMPEELRKSVKRFKSSTGTTDLYVIFYELGLSWLNDTGKLGYIAPNSWMKNISQKGFRKLLLKEKLLSRIFDYGSYPVFGKDADAYTSVVILDKNPLPAFSYTQMTGQETSAFTLSVPYSSVEGHEGVPLVFSSTELLSIKEGVKLQDICVIQNGFCTLRNDAFLSPDDVEEEILRPVVKASRYKGGEVEGTILFPYDVNDGTVVPMSEERLLDFPKAYAHFMSHEEDLLNRKTDKSALWFHYGRSQGLRNISKPKLILSINISPSAERVRTYEVSAETATYAGLFITEKEGSGYSLEDIKRIIESEEFMKHTWASSKDISGGYKQFSARVANDFVVPESLTPPSSC